MAVLQPVEVDLAAALAHLARDRRDLGQLGRDDPFIGLVLHVHREVIHHGAEILLLRDLYRATTSA